MRDKQTLRGEMKGEMEMQEKEEYARKKEKKTTNSPMQVRVFVEGKFKAKKWGNLWETHPKKKKGGGSLPRV